MNTPIPTPVAPDSWASASFGLGARVDEGQVTFAVYAPAATRVELELYEQATGVDAYASYPMAKDPRGIWRAVLSGVAEGSLYGFRCWGPNWPYDPAWARGGSAAGFISDIDDNGNRFNPNKVLFDPYAREISHTLLSEQIEQAGGDQGIFGTGSEEYAGRARREHDTGRLVPKGIVIADQPWTAPRPRLAPEQSAIYEAHIRSLTQHPSSARLHRLLSHQPGFEQVVDVPDELRGTYAGAAYLAPYLKALGITTIELLPVHETNTSTDSSHPQLANFWGYQTLAYFAPNRRYAHDRSPGGPTREFKQMVQAFHDAGLEVYLDVVYNHSAEGGNWAGRADTTGFVSLGGFATSDYYVLSDQQLLVDGATGCSNQLNFSVAATQQLVVDSLTYWADVMGVDGFRFDLAPVLGRTPNAFERTNWDQQRRFFQQHPLLLQIRDLAAERQLEVIAEAWDLWGYEVGSFPSGWGEWNGRYRDSVRAFLKGDGNVGEVIDMVNGDYAHFNDQGGPQRSINFITAHDGFTLADLVSYNGKVNDQPYPFGPSDGGSDANLSWDSGGDHALRRQRIRNFLTLLYLSRGVPMIVSGDEYGRTQNGNNNPWCIDTIGIWNNWAMAGSNAPQQVPVDPDHPDLHYHDNLGQGLTPDGVNPLLRFTAFVARLRQRHPGLRQRAYGDAVLGGDDVSYLFLSPDGQGHPSGSDRCLVVLIDCAATGAGDLCLLINMADQQVSFAVPQTSSPRPWRILIDTATQAEPYGNVWEAGAGPVAEGGHDVQAWSIVVLSNADREDG